MSVDDRQAGEDPLAEAGVTARALWVRCGGARRRYATASGSPHTRSPVGRKGYPTERATLPRFELDEGRLKINPLADWSKADLDAYFADHKLPRRPLEAQGYPSIGCVPCTTTVAPGEDPAPAAGAGGIRPSVGYTSRRFRI